MSNFCFVTSQLIRHQEEKAFFIAIFNVQTLLTVLGFFRQSIKQHQANRLK